MLYGFMILKTSSKVAYTSEMKYMALWVRSVPFAFALVFGNCIGTTSTDDAEADGMSSVVKHISQNEELWNEDSRRYSYRFEYYSGFISSTKNGDCQIFDSVVCEWRDGTGEQGVGKEPGRIQSYFQTLEEINSEIAPDSIRIYDEYSFSVIQIVQANDSLKVPYGYSVWFNPELGYIDSIIIYPFGPQLRISSLKLEEQEQREISRILSYSREPQNRVPNIP